MQIRVAVLALCVLSLVALLAAPTLAGVKDDAYEAPLYCRRIDARSARGAVRRLNLKAAAFESFKEWARRAGPNRMEYFSVGVCSNNADCGPMGGTGVCQIDRDNDGVILGHQSRGMWPPHAPRVTLDEAASPLGSIVMETELVNGDRSRVTIHCNPYLEMPGTSDNATYTPPRSPNAPRTHEFTLSHAAACGLDPLPTIPSMCHDIVAMSPDGRQKKRFNLDELSQLSVFFPSMASEPSRKGLTMFSICRNRPLAISEHVTIPMGAWLLNDGSRDMQSPDATVTELGVWPADIMHLRIHYLPDDFEGGAIRLQLPRHKNTYDTSVTVICDPDAGPFGISTVISSPKGTPPPIKHSIYIRHRVGCGA